MKVIICGAGQVGEQIARHLSFEKNDITVIDNNSELIGHLSNTLDISGITGCASHPDILEAAGVESVSELRRRNPESLHESMDLINVKAKIVERMPSLKRVNKWIEDSKDIEIKVSS